MPKPLTVWITINCGKFFKWLQIGLCKTNILTLIRDEAISETLFPLNPPLRGQKINSLKWTLESISRIAKSVSLADGSLLPMAHEVSAKYNLDVWWFLYSVPTEKAFIKKKGVLEHHYTNFLS